ncbi:MAG: hypothetical protein LC104_13555 [Bacteroidales bacterium]|nr:hypothetical protein [Bacteroidales bacterium]
MSRICLKLFIVSLFGITTTALTVLAEDPPAEVPKKQDWSAYATFSEIAGEVVKFEDPILTLKITTYTQSGGGGGRGRGRGRRPQIKATHKEVDLNFAEQGLVRWQKPAPKMGANGRKVPHSFKEIQMMKLPQGAPGYLAARSDLVPGQIVALTLVRPRDVPLSKVTETDLQIKYAVIAGSSNVAADPGAGLGAGFEKKEK